jgi:hypothetical protein
MIKILLLSISLHSNDSTVYLANFTAIEAKKLASSFIPNSIRRMYIDAKREVMQKSILGATTIEVLLNKNNEYLSEEEVQKIKALFLKDGFKVEYYRNFNLDKVYFRISWAN